MNEPLRAGHVDDVVNPVDPETLCDRLREAGFADATVEVLHGEVRFRAATNGGSHPA